MTKSHLKTVRFSEAEREQIDRYLRQNPLFEGFSALARVATLTFICHDGAIRLTPLPAGTARRPRFLWDYDLGEVEAREILCAPGLSPAKRWLIERILLQARSDEVFAYLTLREIRAALPHLRLPPKIRERWDYAVAYWSRHDTHRDPD